VDERAVVILERVTVLSMRMRRALEGSRVCVYDADSKFKLYNTIYKVGDSVSLVILDLDIEQDLAIELLRETRRRLQHTPILVLSPARARNFFVEAMLTGATDFILKPFTDEVFISKVSKYLYPENEKGAEIVTTDLGRYLKGELRKAEKGHFSVSILFLVFEKQDEPDAVDPAVSAYIFDHIKELFWETDVFIHFASKYYLGIFPFCDDKNTKIIDQKIHAEFEKIKVDNEKVKDYSAVSVFVSYPNDTADTANIFDLLIARVREKLSQDIYIELSI